jgi:formamidopyrimidine-DNA glycosylase
MPELPEVETTIQDLKREIINLKINDVWTDAEKIIKKPPFFRRFKKGIRDRKITGIQRRGKNILIGLSGNKVLLIHLKMTGHLLVGRWEREAGKWRPASSGSSMKDSQNRFLHLIFFFNNNKQMALSDLRKFAKVELWDRGKLEMSGFFKKLGREPLEKTFTLGEFKKALNKRRSGIIKQVLMDQGIVVGIGNIYANEILWEAEINPFKDIRKLRGKELERIYKALKKVLRKGIKLGGASYSDFRRLKGQKGGFQSWGRVYNRENEDCCRCQAMIKREKAGGRSVYFCPSCQS